MGVEWHTAKLLIAARNAGVRFDKTLTLGRQNLHLGRESLRELFEQIDGRVPDGFNEAMNRSGPYADEFLKLLSSRELVTMDASAYEGAAVVHDMNTPVPPSLHEQFDVTLDGGTLEHVFNFPMAIRNCMEMTKVGGSIFIVTPANGFLGHGFYQFSPELFYRVFSAENGFEIARMRATEQFHKSQWYEVADPAQLGARVELVPSEHRVLLLVQARRVEKREIFSKTPQQSDYVSTWNRNDQLQQPEKVGSNVEARPSALQSMLERTAPGMVRWIRSRSDAKVQRRFGLHVQPSVFRPVDR